MDGFGPSGRLTWRRRWGRGGAFLVVDSDLTLISAEHPTIGTLHLFGQTVGQGWLMMGALVLTGVPNVLLGRAKMKLAEPLHDKVLHADAAMNKADWMTAFAAVAGWLGSTGCGRWRSRMRDMGHVFYTEVLVVPVGDVTLERLESARKVARALAWKLDDLVVVPVSELPGR